MIFFDGAFRLGRSLQFGIERDATN